MKALRLLSAACAGVAAWGISGPGSAALATFQSRPLFESAIAGLTQTTVDFDQAALGSTIPSASTFGGIGFSYALTDLRGEPLSMVVDGAFETPSPPHYLALQTPRGELVNFVSGDTFTMDFLRPVNAIGLDVIANDTLIAGDRLSLSVSNLEATSSGPLPPSATLADGGQLYFLGLVSDRPFRSAVFSVQGSALEFVHDDISYAVVPLPPALWLFGIGLATIARLVHHTGRRQQGAAQVAVRVMISPPQGDAGGPFRPPSS